MRAGNIDNVAAQLRLACQRSFLVLSRHSELLYYVARCMPQRPPAPPETIGGANHVQAYSGRQ